MGLPVFLTGEDEKAYFELLSCVSDAVKPADILDKILVEDYVDFARDVVRLRRLRAELVISTIDQGLKRLLLPLLHSGANGEFVPSASRHPYSSMEAKDWAERYLARDPEAIKKVDDLLKGAGLTKDAVAAHTLVANLRQIDCIDRMIMAASQRRDAVLREIDRRRASLADKLRRATADVEADLEIVPANTNQTKGAK
jgi:hypothetical protein